MIVTIKHIRACKICAIGAKKWFLENGMTKEEVQDFFKNGMELEKFKELFGHDIMAQQVIEMALKDG